LHNKTLARKTVVGSKPSKETWKNFTSSKFSRSPKSAERVNRHFPTLLQVHAEQQEAVLLYVYYIYIKNIFNLYIFVIIGVIFIFIGP